MPTCLSALSCYLVIGWLEIYVNEQFNWCKMAGERILWGFIFTKPAGKFQKIIFLHESPPVFPKNNFRVLAQIRVMSRTSVFLIADSVQSLELIPAVIEQNSGYTLVMSPVRRPIHPHTPIQTWVKGFKLTNSSKEKEEAFICCSACWTVQINSVKTRDHNWPVNSAAQLVLHCSLDSCCDCQHTKSPAVFSFFLPHFFARVPFDSSKPESADRRSSRVTVCISQWSSWQGGCKMLNNASVCMKCAFVHSGMTWF